MGRVIKFDLKRFRKANKMNQKAFAEILGVTQGFVSRIENGGSNIPESLMDTIYNYNEWAVPPDVISVAMLKEQEETSSEENAVSENMIPLLPYDAIAGPGSFNYQDEQIEDYYKISDFKNSDFLIRVKGDSMSPKYTGGDIIACQIIREVLFFQWGRSYALCTKSQGLMIKRLMPSKDEDCVTCVSYNEQYPPFDIPKEDIAEIALINGTISLE